MPRPRKFNNYKWMIVVLPLAVFGVSFFVSQGWGNKSLEYLAVAPTATTTVPMVVQPVGPLPIVVTHLPTPEPLRALYMTSWVAGTASIRDRLINIADTTEINSFVIDIKDYSGRIAWLPEDLELIKLGAGESRIRDVKKFLADLHTKNIYLIGRISVFQDQYLVSKRPDLAVKRASDGGVWRDRKGIAWLDASKLEVWEYIVRLAREAYATGFDEVNFDYIRFPSDGDMKDIAYEGAPNNVINRAETLEKFFSIQEINKVLDIMKSSS